MRSRYTAYVLHDIDYIVNTHAPETVHSVDRNSVAQWSRKADWQGLEIVSSSGGGFGEDHGMVEFIARYLLNGKPQTHHEKSRFTRVDGTWFYVDGDMVLPRPVVITTPRVGRNDSCPCGSGKKFKKCCGSVAKSS